jgi:hypothetical protein
MVIVAGRSTRSLEGMEYVVAKIDAATDQLDWAVRLLVDHQAYIPAITLAGAAEEIIGETLGERSIHSHLRSKFASQLGVAEKVISQGHLNRARNWLKHWKDLKDEETVTLDLEGEAIQYIVRAITNLVIHDRSLPSEGPRFLKWLRENHKELMPSNNALEADREA